MSPQHRTTEPKNLLSAREMDILQLLADGHAKKDIADLRGISITTVAFHVRNIYKKLGVQNAAAAIARAFRSGIFK